MKDMTEGNPLKLIIGFAIPMLVSSIFQQLYAMVDTLIVSRYLGPEALAGVGSTGTLTLLILTLALGMGNGGGLIISQCYGSRNYKRLRQTIVAMTWVMGILGILVSWVGYQFAERMLRALKVPENVLGFSVSYLQIIMAFTMGAILYNWGGAILRSVGDSKTPLYALLVSSFVNIGLDLLLITQFHMGVEGAAIATVVSQMISGMVCLVFIIRKRRELGFDGVAETEEESTQSAPNAPKSGAYLFLPEWHQVRLVVQTSIPSIFQSAMISIGGISVQRLINSFGADVMAGYAAACKVDALAIQVILSLGGALGVFTGQNMGRGLLDRIREGLRRTLVLNLISATIIAVCAFVFRRQIMGLFMSGDEGQIAMEVGAEYLSIVGVAYLVCAVMQSYQNVIRGAGDVNTCMVAGLTELAGKIIFAYLLAPHLGATGIWLSTPLSWACGCVIPVVRYYSGKWQYKKLVE